MQNRLQPCVFYYKQPVKKARLAHVILLYLYSLDQALLFSTYRRTVPKKEGYRTKSVSG